MGHVSQRKDLLQVYEPNPLHQKPHPKHHLLPNLPLRKSRYTEGRLREN